MNATLSSVMGHLLPHLRPPPGQRNRGERNRE